MQEQNSANLLVGRSGVMDPTWYMLRDLISQGDIEGRIPTGSTRELHRNDVKQQSLPAFHRIV